jgi:hypothetical protein
MDASAGWAADPGIAGAASAKKNPRQFPAGGFYSDGDYRQSDIDQN